MLNSIFIDLKREVTEIHDYLASHIHDSEVPDLVYLADGAKALLKKCEAALTHALTHEQYVDVLNIAGVWKFFLDGRQIRYDFLKPRRKDLFRESILRSSPKTASFSNLRSGFWSDGKVIMGAALRDTIDRTVPIRVERSVKHPKTGKYLKRSKTFLVHDEFNKVSKGDVIVAYECRPISKRKNFMLCYIFD